GERSRELPVELQVLCGGGIPRQLGARPFGARARARKGVAVAQELACSVCERVDVARRDNTTGAEAADRLGEAGNVVGDRRNARAERLQQGSRLVELGAIREERDGGLGERAVELG